MSFKSFLLLTLCIVSASAFGDSQPWNADNRAFRNKRAHIVTQTETVTETTTVTSLIDCTPTNLVSDYSTTILPSTTSDTAYYLAKDPSPAADAVTETGSCYSVPGVGIFTTKKVYEFDSDNLPSDLQVSSYLVYDRKAGNPWNHGFETSNVYVQDGYLHLVVPGGQDPAEDSRKAIYGGEATTAEQEILYGSVRTNAIFDGEPGTCQGIFSYHDDYNEIDIEYLSNSSSAANPSPDMPPVLWYTNQPGTSSSQKTGGAPSDVNSDINEYRIDWTPSWTKFYLNGVLQRTLTTNVPHVGSQWVWNNWANGNADWSTGPPVNDNVFRIDSITMYYNTTDGGSCW